MDKAIFAGGCFWCTETIFSMLKGVYNVIPGYIGGHIQNPTYKEVCQGTTGHAEAIEIIYDPQEISFRDLLAIFFDTHDPTTLNRQGGDIGEQYRSEIFYTSEEQKKQAEAFIKFLEGERIFSAPIVTRLSEAGVFYKAEDYHLNYYTINPDQLYCQSVISPKVQKFLKKYQANIKTGR